MQPYDASCYTVTPESTPDPFMVRANGYFHLTFTAGNRIEIWSSKHLVDFQKEPRKRTVWTPPPASEHSADLWAPELHALRGRWYIYYAAANPAHGNRSHRMYVLGGPPACEDPTQGQWEFLGRIHGMPDQWAIDGTVFELDKELYFVYSGWPLGDTSGSDLTQQLFIMRLEDPTIAESRPIMISTPELPWEFTNDCDGFHGINEGPQYLESRDGSWKGIVFSCAGSWTHEYKLAVLHYNGGDPLDASSWPKAQEPLLQAAEQENGPWGPGHGSFLSLGKEIVCVFHGTDNQTDGWDNRKARCQRVIFTEAGPYMAGFCGGVQPLMPPKQSIMARIRRRLSRRKVKLAPPRPNTMRTLLESH
ncbi:hypothetical protein JX266_009240 [Neoarthrinium moseri]|nr:hypothetical protein JX266_009240 [Neoarthrinium moseri]